MPDRIIKRLVGGLKPWKPTRSLPSYKEPTPETSRQLSREQEAEIALKHTAFTPGAATLLVALFVITIAIVPALQLATELRGGKLRMFEVFRVLPNWTDIAAVRNGSDVWQLLPHAEELKTAEKALESESVVSESLLPIVQSFLTGKLRAGNEQVYLGRDGWLFYRPDVDYVTGPPFLDPAQMKRRAHAAGVEADPVKAIVHFRDQLAARGIELIVMPVPTKATIEGEKLSERVRESTELQNTSFAVFKATLDGAGVRIFDPAESLVQRRAATKDHAAYLQTDTHWRPETMQFAAEQLARSLQLAPRKIGRALDFAPKEITGVGDIARMLKLPETQQLYPSQKVTVQQVAAGNGLWRPDPDADVLLLGDSFANIFSLEALGWGEAAGFAEHLSAALGGRALDCILRNSDGAFATREMLARELARGRDRLAGKKLVIWEFAARELAFGNWKLLEMKLGSPAAARFYTPPPGQEVEVTGTIEAISSAPRPGTVPYTDHIVALHLSEMQIAGSQRAESLQSLVYLSSMRDNIWTPAARFRPGDRIKLKLRAWSEVSGRAEQINRSDLDDPALQLEEPVWGDLIL